MARKPAVHVIDDDDAMRDSVSFLLQASGFDVTTHESAKGFLERYRRAPMTCVITDVRMPDMSGIDLLLALKNLGSRAPVIVMTGHGDVPLAVEAMKAGAMDFLEKPFEEDRLLAAVSAAVRNEERQNEKDVEAAALRAKILALSNRERQVLHRLVAGHANKVIALELGISPRTVEVYRANLMTKMQAASLSELVRMTMIADLGATDA